MRQGKPITVNLEDFLRKAKETHGELYDYSKVIIEKSTKKINIICKVHGVFSQCMHQHIIGRGCRHCAFERIAKLKTDKSKIKFFEKAKEIHGEKYNYNKVNYTNATSDITITCLVHGDFIQNASDHIRGRGCKKCAFEGLSDYKLDLAKNSFEQRARVVHGDKYDYSKVVYKNSSEKVQIICPIHGVFEQKPCNHIKRSGCQQCAKSGFQKSKEAYLYVFRCENFVNSFTGYGITNNIADRLQAHSRELRDYGYKVTAIRCFKSDGEKIDTIESAIIKSFEVINQGIKGFKQEATKAEYFYDVIDFIENFKYTKVLTE